MTEDLCGVCRSPRDPGAARCANCGASFGASPQRGFAGSVTKPGAGRPVALVLGVLVLAAGAGAAFLVSGAKSSGRTSEVAAPREEAVQEVASESDEVPPVEAPAPEAAEEVSPPAAFPGAAPSLDAVTLTFNARVTSAKGKALSKGAKCQVNAHVADASVQDLDVACGNTVLYDSRTPLNGMASYGSDVFERRRGQTWVYRLLYTDVGQRTSRSQASVNSTQKTASVFGEGADAFRVELAVDEYSQPRSGDALMDSPPEPAKVELSLTVASQSGEPPSLGAGCSFASALDEMSAEGPRCKSELRCGSKVLYGKGPSTGFGPCVVSEGTIVAFTDTMQTHDDGDPALVLDAEARTVTYSDSPSQRDFEVVFSFAK